MALVSNFRVYAERKYKENGEWKSEEIELGQIGESATNNEYKNLTVPDEKKFYYYQENRPSTHYYPFLNGNTKYFAFKPGTIYISPKYFTISDLFTAEDISTFMNDVMNAFKYADYTKSTYFFKVSSKSFWKTPEGYNITFVLKSEISKASYNFNIDKIENIRRGAVFRLDYMVSKIDPSLITCDGEYYYFFDITKEENVPMIQYKDYCTGSPSASSGYLHGGPVYKETSTVGYASEYEFLTGLNRFISMLAKVKFRPFWSFGIGIPTSYPDIGVKNHTFKNPATVEETKDVQNPNGNDGLYLAFDISDCPNFPTTGIANGIYIGKQYVKGQHFNQGCVTRIDWTEGVESNNPDETDDPNVDDPGVGPGQDPDDEGGDGDHDNTTDPIDPPPLPNLSASGIGLVTIYNPTSSQLGALGAKLWAPDVLEAIKQFFTNPMDTIIGCSIIPVKPKVGTSSNIHLGLYDTGISAPVVDSDYVIINCGSIPINRYYGSYLDYDPYTKISCYLPYIGEIEVDPDQVMQTSLMVLYYVNVITGDIVAMLCANESIIYTAAGNCVRQLPMSQSDYSAIINTAVTAVSTIAGAAVGAGLAGAVGGAVAGAAKTSAGVAVAEAKTNSNITNQVMGAGSSLIGNVMSSKMRYNHAGSMGTGSGQLTYQTPYLTIERPNLDLSDNYKSFVGYPCNKTLQLSRCTGFTQIEATKLSISGATDEEVTEILQYLVEGVII